MVGNFSNRLAPFGVKVRELTGDMNLSRAEIEETQVQGEKLHSVSSNVHVLSVTAF